MASTLFLKSLPKSGASKIRRWTFVATIFILSICLYCILISPAANRKKELTNSSCSEKHSIDIYPPPLSDVCLTWKKTTAEYVAICLVVKNQALDLPEFIIHHYFHLGIKRFYIMDDGSIPPLEESLANIDLDDAVRSALTFVYWSAEQKQNRSRMQFYLYDECVRRFGDRHTWMAFIDADELLEMTAHPRTTLNDFLCKFEDGNEQMLPRDSALRGKIGAVGINWRTHNSNGIVKRPSQGECRKTFTSCLRDFSSAQNHLIKSIVKTKWYDKSVSVHIFRLKDDRKTVDELGGLLEGRKRLPITRIHIALHHYTVKSKEEFKEKMVRGGNVHKRDWSFWSRMQKTPNITCNELASYRP